MAFSFKTDLRNENFDLYFVMKAAEMTSREKDLLPKEAISKIFTTKGNVTTKPIPFLLQLYVLTKAMNHTAYLVVKDEDKGFDLVDYNKYRKDVKKRKVTKEFVDLFHVQGEFVLGNNEVIDWLEHMNRTSISPAVNYSLKLLNTKKITGEAYDKAFLYMCSLLTKYESQKKRIVKTMGCPMPEWYVLLYLADGKEKKMAPAYNELFYDALNGSRNQIIRAFKSLVGKGWVKRFSLGKNVDYQITALGRSMIREVMNKYIIP